MTSTPVNLLSLRSNQSADRPVPATLQQGQLAVSYGSSDPGIYFEDSAGNIRKVGPNHYGATAPNTGAVGQTGNSTGETWVDSSTASYYMKVWDGSTWRKIGAGFADAATTANSANTATFASSANSAVIASGALTADTADLSSASIISSGVAVTSSLPASSPQGTVMYQAAAPSGLYVYVGSAWVPV